MRWRLLAFRFCCFEPFLAGLGVDGAFGIGVCAFWSHGAGLDLEDRIMKEEEKGIKSMATCIFYASR